ncbi:MAG: tRNA (N6-isopentenyl adenosine(37)-C2)-methylthiotransferase MiaB [Thermoleophilia bacterium]|nr:tRNA (N6-isopentenyl adenosine(37)-C2)-methylthiotransferase MiaB [Thermoleophilia bacterium]
MRRASVSTSASSQSRGRGLAESGARTYYLRTFGCQMNDHDSERIAGVLEQQGLVRVTRPEDASVIVFNTCSIREKADRRLAAHLEAASRLKTIDPSRLVVVAGCLAQSRRELLLEDFPFVDVLVGPQSLHELPTLLERREREGRPVGAFQEFTTRWSADLPRSRVEGPSAWVQITAGCTNFCSYCIVPYVRGPEASRPLEEILTEVRDLVKQGVKEVVFLGQNVNAYGKEPGFAGSATFADLLREACRITGLERIRFMTSHPKDVSDELIAVMAEPNQVCEHLHLPAQSGSDSVLAAMRRGYDRASYIELVKKVRAAVPGVAITTDLIVGFPGETDEDFGQTLTLVEECEFDGAFTFIYSPRPHTAAANLPNRVPRVVAQERMQRLVELVQRTARRRNEALVGQVVEVMVEGPSRQCSREVMGRTRTYKPVNFASNSQPGDLVMVELLEATSASFRGRQVEVVGREGPQGER